MHQGSGSGIRVGVGLLCSFQPFRCYASAQCQSRQLREGGVNDGVLLVVLMMVGTMMMMVMMMMAVMLEASRSHVSARTRSMNLMIFVSCPGPWAADALTLLPFLVATATHTPQLLIIGPSAKPTPSTQTQSRNVSALNLKKPLQLWTEYRNQTQNPKALRSPQPP